MKQKGDLTKAERLEIGILLKKGYSLRSIAKEMKRSPNTISYEIRQNSGRGQYDPDKADQKTKLRKRLRRFQWSKIEKKPDIKRFIIKKLKAHWNPDEIAGYLKRTKDPWYVSKSAIYDWLRTSRGERYCDYLYSKRKRVKPRKPKVKRVLIPDRTDIKERSQGAKNRTRYGHFERDTVVSKKGAQGGVAMHQDRKGKLVIGLKVHSMRPKEHAKATRRVANTVVMKSATTDNGIENKDHKAWGVPTFFCAPYSSWQKGGIENVNKMFRAFFPKGTDFGAVTQREIDAACRIINEKPRKSLGYRSSLEVSLKAGIIKNKSVLIEG